MTTGSMRTYLLINLLTIAVPLALSFERRVSYFKKWKYLFPAIGLTAFLFIVWDIAFTARGVWGFNDRYLTGLRFWGLPVEEILFFFCIPFSCLFIYEVLCYCHTKDIFGKSLRFGLKILSVALVFAGMWNFHRTYTSTTFFLLAAALGIHIYILRSKYLDRFLQMYLISLVPFLIVNGILTNGLRAIDPGPVVWYNNDYNISFRVLGIPLEDFFYSMLMLLTNITFYEHFKRK